MATLDKAAGIHQQMSIHFQKLNTQHDRLAISVADGADLASHIHAV